MPPCIQPSERGVSIKRSELNRFIFLDLERSQAVYQVKLRVPPPQFPVSTIKVMRLLTAIQQDCPSYLEKASRQLWVNHPSDKSFDRNVIGEKV
jgi:2-hydroxychromene-2-carboxylate isomerase